jgi:hypothetical protein
VSTSNVTPIRRPQETPTVGMTTHIRVRAGAIFATFLIGAVFGFAFGYAKGQMNMMDVMSAQRQKDIREESEQCGRAIDHAYETVEDTIRKTR